MVPVSDPQGFQSQTLQSKSQQALLPLYFLYQLQTVMKRHFAQIRDKVESTQVG